MKYLNAISSYQPTLFNKPLAIYCALLFCFLACHLGHPLKFHSFSSLHSLSSPLLPNLFFFLPLLISVFFPMFLSSSVSVLFPLLFLFFPPCSLSPSFSFWISCLDSGFLSVSLVSFQSPSLECWQKRFFFFNFFFLSLKTKRLNEQIKQLEADRRLRFQKSLRAFRGLLLLSKAEGCSPCPPPAPHGALGWE